MGATSGRTTLNGEGLQHQDGHGLLLASTVPNCLAYDPTFAYEVAILIKRGIERMYIEGEDVFYYITLLNENYPQPEKPKGVEEGIDRGMYLYKKGKKAKLKVQLMGSGAILREVIAAALLLEEYNVSGTIWSVPGINQLHREGQEIERWNRLNPAETPKKSWVEQCLERHPGPAILATDYLQAYGEQIRRLVQNPLTVLGTDGYGRSDSRQKLRDYFGVDRYHIATAALAALVSAEELPLSVLEKAVKNFAGK